MKLVKKLSKTEQKTLEDMRDNHFRKITRKRAHSILLNQEGTSQKGANCDEHGNICTNTD